MVGDSLSSDMQGGRNAGIPTCFYGKREKADARCDYVIEDLLEDMDAIIDASQPYTLEEWEKRPWLRRMAASILKLGAIWL